MVSSASLRWICSAYVTREGLVASRTTITGGPLDRFVHVVYTEWPQSLHHVGRMCAALRGASDRYRQGGSVQARLRGTQSQQQDSRDRRSTRARGKALLFVRI